MKISFLIIVIIVAVIMVVISAVASKNVYQRRIEQLPEPEDISAMEQISRGAHTMVDGILDSVKMAEQSLGDSGKTHEYLRKAYLGTQQAVREVENLMEIIQTGVANTGIKPDDELYRMDNGRADLDSETTRLAFSRKDGDFRILVADNNEMHREILVNLLSNGNVTVDTAENGIEAVAKVSMAEKAPYDIVFMDLMMPVMNGVEAAKKIRELDNPALAGVPIIALTVNSREEDWNKVEKAGMDTLLTKPVDAKKLKETILKYL